MFISVVVGGHLVHHWSLVGHCPHWETWRPGEDGWLMMMMMTIMIMKGYQDV